MSRRLTLAAVHRFTLRALKENGLGHAKIMDLGWQGQRCRYRDGSPVWFRVAWVKLAMPDGRTVTRWASVDTTGGYSI